MFVLQQQQEVYDTYSLVKEVNNLLRVPKPATQPDALAK